MPSRFQTTETRLFLPNSPASDLPSCSLEADHAEGAIVPLEHHDVSYVRVSRAPLEKIQAYRKRMGWTAVIVSGGDASNVSLSRQGGPP
jgi:predicted dithiol-disulfide oxidoreductase (DUF899 family)